MAIAATASATPLVRFVPLEKAPYSAAAVVSPYAARVFLSGVSAAPGEALGRLRQTLEAETKEGVLVNVRAHLGVPAGPTMEMSAWNAAWEGFFGSQERPTRTTVGAREVYQGAPATVEAVAVAAYDPQGGLPGRRSLSGTYSFWGEGPYGSAGAAMVEPGQALIFTAGMLADPIDTAQPEGSTARYGDVRTQSLRTFTKLEAELRLHGSSLEHAFYVRALLSPPPEGGTVDYDGFGAAFQQIFTERHPWLRPALTIVTGPGFSSSGRLVEIEVYAGAPAGPPRDEAAARAKLEVRGNPEGAISSSARVPGFTGLTWFAGVVPARSGDLHEQSVDAFLTLLARLKQAGAAPAQVVQLRSYPQVGDDFEGNFAKWNEAYGRFFNHPKLNAHKPARTAFPSDALPGPGTLEIEVVAVTD